MIRQLLACVSTLANIAVKIFGRHLAVLRATAESVQATIEGVPGLVDLAVKQETDIPTVRVQFDRNAVGRYGLPAGRAAEALEEERLVA